jgi:hypothetical protein
MRTRSSSVRALVAALALGTLAACGGAGGGPSIGGDSGVLKVFVTDAPFPYSLVESASIVVREVRARDTSTDSWVVLFSGEAEIDLVPLSGGVSELLVSAAVPPGTYDEVRLIVDGGEVVLSPDAVVEGDSHTFTKENGGLHCPSAAQSGVKVKMDEPIVVVTQLSSDLTLDFDLSKNFVFNGPMTHAPGVKRVLFTPVVRATNTSTAGSVAGTVWTDNATPGDTTDDTPLAGATVSVADPDGVEAASGPTDAAGAFSFSVAPGTYDVTASAAGHDSATVEDAQVFLANLTDVGAILLAATAGEITGTVLSDGATPADPADDTVLAGATVEAFLQGETVAAASTTTDAQGAFQFAMLAPGTYDLAVSAAGFTSLTLVGIVPTASGTGTVATLAALTAMLGGTVSDTTATPIAGVDVTVVNSGGITVATAVTDASGQWSATVATGSYEVTFSDPVSLLTTTLPVVVVGAEPPPTVTLDATL